MIPKECNKIRFPRNVPRKLTRDDKKAIEMPDADIIDMKLTADIRRMMDIRWMTSIRGMMDNGHPPLINNLPDIPNPRDVQLISGIHHHPADISSTISGYLMDTPKGNRSLFVS